MRISPAAAVVASSLVLSACVTRPLWQADWSPTEEAVAAALGDSRDDGAYLQSVVVKEVPDVPVRKHLRPCCAFGADIRVKVAGVPVPGVALENIIGPEDIGHHKYDSGMISRKSDRPRIFGSSEANGLVYTCRGGFVDTAHLRDYADWTLFVAAQIGRRIYDGGTIELPGEGGTRRLIVRPVVRRLLDQHGLAATVVPIAQWATFQMSIWHEIITWFGWSATGVFSEKASSFSPEDLYSNMLGVKIGGGIIRTQGARTDRIFSHNMDDWTAAVFERLQAVPAEDGLEAARHVDKVWWDSTQRVPEMALVMRRNFGIGPEIKPWRVAEAYWSEFIEEKQQEHCGGKPSALVLGNPDAAFGVKFRDVVTLEIVVDAGIKGFPFPRRDSRRVTQDDFPGIIEAIKVENRKQFGPGAALPERDEGGDP